MLFIPRSAVLASSLFALSTLLGAGLLAPACGSSGETPSPADSGPPDGGTDDGAVDASQDWLVPPPIARTKGEGDLGPLRQACAFDAGAWAAETIGKELPLGTDIPINHVIVIMQENRSFDHYLGRLVAQGYYNAGDFTTPDAGSLDAGGAADSGASDGATADGGDDASPLDASGDDAAADAGAGSPDAATTADAAAGGDAGPVPGEGFAHSDEVDVPPPGWGNPNSDGSLVYPHADDEYCYGVDHSWAGQHNDYDNGKMDGFVKQNNPDGQRVMFYEDDKVIPFYYALASTFSVGDRYFCSALTSTWPNRLFLMAGTSFGIGDNSPVLLDTVEHPAPQIFNLLVAGGHSWKDYTDSLHMVQFFPNFGFDPDTRARYGTIQCGLMVDIASGTLPDVSFVMGDEVTEDSDEGPKNLPGIGGILVEQIVRAVFASPSWKDTAIFITYDENGGLADHVPPAPACAPDGYAAHDQNNNPLPGGFGTTGYRVPFIVISPYARAHYASHVVHDHTSITRFIEARFGLPAMTARDANATPPYEMFDFQNPPFMTPPNITAHTTMPQSILDLPQCMEKLAPASCAEEKGAPPDGG